MNIWIQRLCSDNEGNLSSMRVVFLLLGLTFIPAFVFVWVYVSIYNRVLSDIPSGVYALLGTLLVGKSVQKGIEVFGEIKKNSLDTGPTIP